MTDSSSSSSSNPKGEQPPTLSRLERIARRAREIYEARGGGPGRELDDWLAAEREIDDEIEREQTQAH